MGRGSVVVSMEGLRRHALTALLALLALVGLPVRAAEVAVAGLSIVRGEVRVALSGPIERPRTFALAAPLRLVVDLPGASTRRVSAEGAGTILRARAAQLDAGTVRLIIDIKSPMKVEGVTQDRRHRLVIRLAETEQASFDGERARGRRPVPGFEAAGTNARRDEVAAAQAAVDEAAATKAASRRGRGGTRPLVVIDAGHGGHDPGAPSVIGGWEKDVTLAIASEARRAIEAGGRLRVRLTRSDDRFLSLGERVRIAREAGASLFISIHADAAPNPAARGASIYTLSEVASDREAARLAARENRADGGPGLSFGKADPEVAGILVDLVQRETMNRSAEFAGVLRAKLEPKVTFRTDSHRFAGFRVLTAPDIPSVLLETGYMSNESDSRRLFTREGRQAIGRGIARAAEAWLAGGISPARND